MTLEEHEIKSALWQKLREHYEQELATLRKKNDADMGLEATAKLRGRILAVKDFLLLDKPDPAPPAGTESGD